MKGFLHTSLQTFLDDVQCKPKRKVYYIDFRKVDPNELDLLYNAGALVQALNLNIQLITDRWTNNTAIDFFLCKINPDLYSFLKRNAS